MFMHRMALELNMPVSELKTRMGIVEMFDWLEYWQRINEGPKEPELADLTSVDQLKAVFG